ncbi:MAG: DUF484 family protein [Proteobacteria bacterium]|nr:DUF484 family protein [Pseudomonadota bacterium]
MQKELSTATLTPEAVELFLKKHTDFLAQRPDLFARLSLPEGVEGGNIASMTAFQARRLQTQVEKLEEKNRLLIHTSLQNMESQAQIHDLALQLLGAADWKGMLDVLDTTLRTTMDVETVTLCLLETLDIDGAAGTTSASTTQMDTFFKNGDGTKLRTLCADDDRTMHGEKQTALQSDALVRIRTADGTPLGLLALGSTRRDRFHAGQAGDLLAFLGGLMGCALMRWTDGDAKRKQAV